jgi:hypothetical protein
MSTTTDGSPVPFARDDLQGRGFHGFVWFASIDLGHVPIEPGVYVVLREFDERPKFLLRNPAGRYNGKDPTVPVEELEAAWPADAQCVYVGKASSGKNAKRHLRKRVKEFRQYGDGRPVAHRGGCRIWQLADADAFTIAWLETPDRDPEDVEGELIHEFVETYGRKPIGNRTMGRSPRSRSAE